MKKVIPEYKIEENGDIVIDIEPKANHRPRFQKNTGTAYIPNDYKRYVELLKRAFKDANIPKKEWIGLDIIFYLKTNKDHFIPHRKKPDWDNLAKGVMDALVKARIVKDDCTISYGSVLKIKS